MVTDMHPVTQYALDVVYGEKRKLCNELEILSCQRHLNDLEKSRDPEWPFVFDETRADRIVEFFGIARQVSGVYSGQPFQLLDWQIFDFGCIYGWVRKDSGRRRFNTAYIREARGQAKSACLSVCGNYAMTADAYYPPGHPEQAVYEFSPEVVCAAVDRGQAKIVEEDIRLIGESSPAIAKRLNIKKHSITHKTRGGKVKSLSKDTKNKDGGRPNLIIVDEYHAHETSQVRDTTSSGKGKKAQCLEIIITTAGNDAENKPCYKEDQLCVKILRGEVIQDDYFVMIRQIDDNDNPHDRSCWPKASPMFRERSAYSDHLLEEVESEYNKAFNSNDPDKIREFLIKRMNRWQADSENRYMSGCMNLWKAGRVSREEFAKRTDGKACWIGFDLGKTTDLSGSGAVFYLEDTDTWGFKIGAFMPQNRASEHEKTDRLPYLMYAADGYCTLTPGSVTDNRYIETWIYDNEQDHKWQTQEICYDGHNAIDLAGRLTDVYSPERVVEIPQTCAGLNAATKKFREIVLTGNFFYEENPIFDWCLDNAVEIRNNFGDIKLSKKHKDDTQRIDPVAAIINALTRALRIERKQDMNKKILSEDWSL